MKMTPSQNLNFMTREEWRDWLKKNHSKANEAWVIIYKKNPKIENSKIGLKYIEAVEEANAMAG